MLFIAIHNTLNMYVLLSTWFSKNCIIDVKCYIIKILVFEFQHNKKFTKSSKKSNKAKRFIIFKLMKNY